MERKYVCKDGEEIVLVSYQDYNLARDAVVKVTLPKPLFFRDANSVRIQADRAVQEYVKVCCPWFRFSITPIRSTTTKKGKDVVYYQLLD